MINYAKTVSKKNKQTAQNKKAVAGQKKNNAGGYVFKVSKMEMLRRFLFLGSEGGTYYTSETKLTKSNAKNIIKLLKESPKEALETIVEISQEGRAPKNDTAIFALALATTIPGAIPYLKDLDAVNKVCRTGTHILQFVSFVDELRGWGRAVRTLVSKWYEDKDLDNLQMQVTKYKNRCGWTHQDVIRMAHPKLNGDKGELAKYILQKDNYDDSNLELIKAVEKAKNAQNPKQIIKLIKDRGIVREHIPTGMLKNPEIWKHMLKNNMPVMAMIRNLGKMSSIGLTGTLSDAESLICGKLHDKTAIQKSKIHPVNILSAHRTYEQGRGDKGSLTWSVNNNIVGALENAFYYSFKNIEPTNKRILIGLDCSPSMTSYASAIPQLTAREAAACMSLVHVKTEPKTHVMGFTAAGGNYWNRVSGMIDLKINKADNLKSVIQKSDRQDWGGTDCALPMVYALEKKIPVDCFIIYTDNDTWAGNIHPFQALKNYRSKMGIDSKLVVCAMTPTKFSIADPNDPGMLDMCGFDSGAPAIISEFIKGNL